MVNLVKKKNNTSERKNEVLQIMNEHLPSINIDETKVGVSNYTQIPFSRLVALGTAFNSLVSVAQNAFNRAGGGSGLYYVNTNGKTMFQKNGENAFIGSLMNKDGTVGGGQARLTQLVCDPTTLFMAATLVNIDKKLDTITKMQQKMMDFLEQKEKSVLKGNLNFLNDVFNNYKYNWNKDIYKQNSHKAAMEIRQDAEAKIVFYREQIISNINNKLFIHSDISVNRQIQVMQDQFKDYQLALYLLAFSSFVEVIMLENYNAEYLKGISEKLESYSVKYRELYDQCCKEIESYSTSSIENSVISGLSTTSKAVGHFFGNIPGLNNTKIDKNLISTGDKLKEFGSSKIKSKMEQLIEDKDSVVKPFVENITLLNNLHNKPIQLLIDKDNLYMSPVA